MIIKSGAFEMSISRNAYVGHNGVQTIPANQFLKIKEQIKALKAKPEGLELADVQTLASTLTLFLNAFSNDDRPTQRETMQERLLVELGLTLIDPEMGKERYAYPPSYDFEPLDGDGICVEVLRVGLKSFHHELGPIMVSPVIKTTQLVPNYRINTEQNTRKPAESIDSPGGIDDIFKLSDEDDLSKRSENEPLAGSNPLKDTSIEKINKIWKEFDCLIENLVNGKQRLYDYKILAQMSTELLFACAKNTRQSCKEKLEVRLKKVDILLFCPKWEKGDKGIDHPESDIVGPVEEEIIGMVQVGLKDSRHQRFLIHPVVRTE